MKTLLQSKKSPSLLVLAVIALPFVGGSSLQAAQNGGPPRAEDQRIGTRIVNFFKDVVYGEKPDTRYKGYGPQPAQPQRRGQPERRYSLDQPPPDSYPEQPRRQTDQPSPSVTTPKPKPQKTLSEDAEPPKKTIKEEEPVAPKKTEPKVKPAPVEDSPPEEKPTPAPAPAKKEVPAPPTVAETERTSPPVPESPKPSFMGPASGNTTPPPPPPSTENTSTPASNSPLVGSKTSTPGRVKSPYPPFNELDVTGLPTGSLAMDPTTQKVFRVP